MSEQGFTVRLSARTDQYVASMKAAQSSTEALAGSGRNLDQLGGKMQDVGSSLSKGVTLPIIAAAGVAVKMSSDFEGAFARMQGLAGVEAGEVDGLKKSVLDLAGKTAQAPQDLADALYDASSAGLTTAQAMDAVTIAAKASATGMGSAKDVVGLIASATASYGAANIDAAKAADILTGTIKAGRADPAELAGSLGRILPVAAQLGISFEQVGGATAYLSNILGDTARTVTSLSGIFNKLVAPTAQGQKALVDMGGSAKELSAAVSKDGLTGALDYLREHGFDKNSQALRAVFDDVEAFNGILALLNDKSGTLASTMEATATSTGSLDTAFGLAADTGGFKMKQAWADIQVALIQAGDVILPMVSGVAGAIGNLATMFSDLPEPVQKIIVVFLGLAAAAGPLLMIGGSLVKNFNLIKSAVTSLGTAAATAGPILAGLTLVVVAATAIYADNQAKKAALTKATNDYVTALEAEAAGTKGAVQDHTAQILADKGLVESAQQRGLSIIDLSNVINGQAVPAFDALRKSADSPEDMVFVGRIDFMRTALADAKDQIDLNARTERELSAATTEADRETRKLTGGIVEQTAAVEAVVPPLALTEEQLKANKDATSGLTDAIKNSTNIFEQMAGAASMLDKALRAVFDPTQNLEDTQQALNKAIAATTESIKDNGKTLDINTDKGNANRDAIQAQANAAMAHGVAMVGMGASNAEATDFINMNIAALRNQLIAAGLTEEQVDAYLTTLGLTPENVATAITLADTEATKERIKGLQEQLGDIDAGAAALITADVDQGKFDEAESKLQWIARTRQVQLDLLPGTGLRLIWAAGTTPLIRFGQTSMGGYFDQEQIRSFAEGGHPEAALPLDNPGRLSQLLSDPRIGAPVAAAMPGGWSGPPASTSTVTNNNAIVNNNHQPVTVDVISRALQMARLS